MLLGVYGGLNAFRVYGGINAQKCMMPPYTNIYMYFSKVYFPKVLLCEVYPTCVVLTCVQRKRNVNRHWCPVCPREGFPGTAICPRAPWRWDTVRKKGITPSIVPLQKVWFLMTQQQDVPKTASKTHVAPWIFPKKFHHRRMNLWEWKWFTLCF